MNKFARFNQEMMKVYVEVQTDINRKRMVEMEEGQKLLEEKQQQNQTPAVVAPKALIL